MTRWYVKFCRRWYWTNRPAYWLERGFTVALGDWWKDHTRK